jgi:hypothetical protein
MRRALAVVLLAALMAAISGLDEMTVARAAQAKDEQHRRQIAERAGTIPIGATVEIQPARGKAFQARLEGVTPESLNVMIVTEDYSLLQTVAFDDIRNLKQVKNASTTKKVLIGAGVAVGVAALIGACAAAVSSADGN